MTLNTLDDEASNEEQLQILRNMHKNYGDKISEVVAHTIIIRNFTCTAVTIWALHDWFAILIFSESGT